MSTPAQQPPAGALPPKPDNYLVWAILVTIFCCLPFGIVALVMSTKIDGLYQRGDYAGAAQASQSTKTWITWGAIIGFVVILVGGGISFGIPLIVGN